MVIVNFILNDDPYFKGINKFILDAAKENKID